MKHPWFLALAVPAAVAVAFLIGRCTGPNTAPVPVGRVDTVETAHVVAGLPDTAPPKGLTRIIRVPVPVDRLISSGIPDTGVARRFARKVFEAESLRARILNLQKNGDQAGADSVERHAPPPVLSPSAGRWDGKRLTLWITLSNGRLMQATAKVRPTWTYTAGRGGLSDTVPLIVGERWWIATLKEAGKCTPRAAVLAGAGAAVDADDRVRGAVLGGVAGLLGCLSD